jgi:hypothetical protein
MKTDRIRVLSSTSLAAALIAFTPACALHPPVQNSGAAIAANGVEVAVLRQSCTETVHRDAFRLRGADGRAIPTTTWNAGEPLSVEAGQARTFELRFMSRGGLSCTKAMQLEAAAGITKNAAPVQIGTVSFVPSHA